MDNSEKGLDQELLQQQANCNGSLPADPSKVTRPEPRSNPIAAFLKIDPLWVLAMAALVFLSYHLRWPAFLPWLWLSMALLPFLIRRVHQGQLRLSTPFDIPIILLLAGALIGVIISPDLYIALGAFQCLLAMAIFYYSWVNHPQIGVITKWLIAVAVVGTVALMIVTLREILGDHVPEELVSTYHGPALALAMFTTVLAGLVLFGKRSPLQGWMALLGTVILASILILAREAFPRLLGGHSIGGRMFRWEQTAEWLSESPITGLGLGAWPQLFHGSTTIVNPTNVHNSYLELYSNMGILGVLALIVSIPIAFKLGRDIWKSPGGNNWRAISIGALMASVLVALVAVVESSPIAIPIVGDGGYLYLMSPAPWILAGLVVSTHRLISK